MPATAMPAYAVFEILDVKNFDRRLRTRLTRTGPTLCAASAGVLPGGSASLPART